MTLLAFAAERRAAVRLAAAAPGGRRCRSISPARRAHNSNPPQAAAAVNRWDRQMEIRIDTMPLHKPCRMLC